MSGSIAGQMQQGLSGATIAVGCVEWFAANTATVNSAAMAVTTLGALYFGYVNARSGKARSAQMTRANDIAEGKSKDEALSEALLKIYSLDLSQADKEKIRAELRN